jgi:pimeloyl-ACP methyl ester carboxylesterase
MTAGGLYREVSGSGDPILLIHGNGANTRIWGRSTADLAATHRVIAYDRRGFGRSAGPPAENMRVHVADAAALLEELDAGPTTVLGWSGGGVVAAGLAIERPEMVSSLILEEGGIHLPLNNTLNLLRFGIRSEYARRLRHDDRRAAEAVFYFALASRNGGNQFDRFPEDWRESMLEASEATVAEIDHLRQPYPTRNGLASISCPVTLLGGSCSEGTFAKINRYLQRRMPSARLVEIEGAAHAVHFDRPEEFRDAVLAAAALGAPGGTAQTALDRSSPAA